VYGRNQGLIQPKKGTQIILPLLFLNTNGIHIIEIPKDEEVVVLKGLLVDINDNKFVDMIKSDEFSSYVESNNKCLPGRKDTNEKWISLTSNSIKNYNY